MCAQSSLKLRKITLVSFWWKAKCQKRKSNYNVRKVPINSKKSPQLVSDFKQSKDRHSFHPRKIVKNIQKGKFLIRHKMEDRKYYYKKWVCPKSPWGPTDPKVLLGTFFKKCFINRNLVFGSGDRLLQYKLILAHCESVLWFK